MGQVGCGMRPKAPVYKWLSYLYRLFKLSHLIQVFSGHSSAVTCGGFSPDGKKVVTGSQDATVRVWDPRTGQTVYLLNGHTFHKEPVTCVVSYIY
jgi:WD40 repeat protein